jgi:hypothetical protein
MSKNRTKKQKYFTSQDLGTKLVHTVRHWTMCIDFVVTLHIEENSP